MDANNPELASRFKFAQAWAREAGKSTLEHFQKGVAVERKSDSSPVTIADRQAEQLLRDRIAAQFPADAILGEEFGEKAGDSGFRWILDPIDGTKSFISGVPLYGTLVGIEYESAAVAGIIEIPALSESISAAKGGGAWYRNGTAEPVQAAVAQSDDLSEGLFVISERYSFDDREAGEVFSRLESEAGITRTWGDCYGYLLVATGRALLMVDPIVSVWDAAALQPIIEEAGGAFTDWSGQPTIHSEEALATTTGLLPQIIEIMRPFRK
jgi:histidinol phosphatase-like enzyme (inositol monophosphatase family)